jgi:Ca2+-binding RTX toxin-like protein
VHLRTAGAKTIIDSPVRTRSTDRRDRHHPGCRWQRHLDARATAGSASGDAGSDSLNAGDGADTAAGVTGLDTIVSGPGHDTLSGGPGRRLVGGDGLDTINGGTGET